MTVAAVADTPHSDTTGTRHYFCCTTCRDTFDTDPARYAEPR